MTLGRSRQILEEGGCAQSEREAGLSRGSEVCKWFNIRDWLPVHEAAGMGASLEQPLDVFVHQVRTFNDAPLSKHPLG
ncbi:protein lin-28 homolog A-like protein [Lates japonicus]|uniref:Protein lin-28 homolog A-like protein n=1 Tax=Lates japonicus TaxID=270547 RepID=A0AAD3MYP0_LATJO|nr:protein lin-28 homolog A-like protein [Lates japonicus]